MLKGLEKDGRDLSIVPSDIDISSFLTKLLLTTYFIVAMLFALIPELLLTYYLEHGGTAAHPRLIVLCMQLTVFIGYFVFQRTMRSNHLTLRYHGAEHKIINAYETKEDFTLEDVKKQSRVHYRCGSAFLAYLFITMVAVIYYSPYVQDLQRHMSYVVLVFPIAVGVCAELAHWLSKLSRFKLGKVLLFPVYLLQKLSTVEPTDREIEVGLNAFSQLEATELNDLLDNI
jgi:uncharacterized protein YqhQ